MFKSINIDTNVINLTPRYDSYFIILKNNEPVYNTYQFDSVNYNIDKYYSDWVVYNDISKCICANTVNTIYEIETNPYKIQDDGYCLTDHYTIKQKLTIDNETLFHYRCDYKALIQYANLNNDLNFAVKQYLLTNSKPDIDLLLEYLAYTYDKELLDKLLSTDVSDITNYESFQLILSYERLTQTQKNLINNYIDNLINVQDLKNDSLVLILTTTKINPNPYIADNRITTEESYYTLATQFRSLTDSSYIRSSKYAFYWGVTFGDTSVESKITDSGYAFKFAKNIRKTKYLKNTIINNRDAYWAYRWALQFKDTYYTDIDDMRDVVLNSSDYLSIVLFAIDIDRINSTHPLYSTYRNKVFASNDPQILYLWAANISDEPEIQQLFYIWSNDYKQQLYIVKYLELFYSKRYFTMEIECDVQTVDLFDRLVNEMSYYSYTYRCLPNTPSEYLSWEKIVTNSFDREVNTPKVWYMWADLIRTELDNCKNNIIGVSNMLDIDCSDVVYNWSIRFGYEHGMRDLVINDYWKCKIQFENNINIG